MNPTELEGLTRLGAAAHAQGHSYFDNPMLLTPAPVQTPEQWADWMALCSAWSAGWLTADAGRDPAMRALCRVRYW